jgi:hypothetical protein
MRFSVPHHGKNVCTEMVEIIVKTKYVKRGGKSRDARMEQRKIWLRRSENLPARCERTAVAE